MSQQVDPRQKLADSVRAAIAEFQQETGIRCPLQIEISWVGASTFGSPGLNWQPGLITLSFSPEEFQG